MEKKEGESEENEESAKGHMKRRVAEVGCSSSVYTSDEILEKMKIDAGGIE